MSGAIVIMQKHARSAIAGANIPVDHDRHRLCGCLPSPGASLASRRAASPPSPTSAHFHASGPRLTRNSDTICWLPGGKQIGHVLDEVEHAGAPADRAGRDSDKNEQSGKKCEKEVIRDRLRDHARSRKNAAKHTKSALRESSRGNHVPALYLCWKLGYPLETRRRHGGILTAARSRTDPRSDAKRSFFQNRDSNA